jgi:hypothetical protein
MHGDLLLVALVLVLGCAGFFIGVIYLACSFFAFIGRSLLGLGRHGGAAACGCGPRLGRMRVCPRERCRKVERRAARYCSQCGAPFFGAGGERSDAFLRV